MTHQTENATFWAGRPVLVTGAGGFIGSHLVERLLDLGADVRAMVHYNSRNDWGLLELLGEAMLDRIDVMPGDVRDPFFCREAVNGRSIVFHLAALIGIPYSYVAPADYVATNVGGTLNILQACRDAGIDKLVHTSTSEAYGTARFTPITEAHPLQAQSPYSASKISADKMAESYHLSFELPVATIRPFNTFGPRQSARAVIPTIISQIAAGRKQIKLGSLSPIRDLNYVTDTAGGFTAIAESDATVGQVVNVGRGEGISIGDLAALIIELMGGGVEVVTDEQRIRPAASEVMELLADNTRAKDLANWQPTVSLREGLQRTVDFVRDHPELYKPDIYNV